MKVTLSTDMLVNYSNPRSSLLNSIGYDIDELTRSLEGVAITVEEIADGVQAIRLTVSISANCTFHAEPRSQDRASRTKDGISPAKASKDDRERLF